MADTLLSVVKRVLRVTGQYPMITTFSDDDDTSYIVDRINDALIDLRSLNPNHLNEASTITITAGTRLYDIASGLDVYDIDVNSLRVDNYAIDWIDVDNLIKLHPDYETVTGEKIRYIYFDDNQIGVYPVLAAGESDQTLKYRHPDVWVRLSATTDTFPYPDPNWVTYCERRAQFEYEVFKGLGNPVATQQKMDMAWDICVARANRDNNMQLRGYRRYER